MSLFRREPEHPARTPSPAPSRDHSPEERRRTGPSGATHIASGTRVEGKITGSTEVLIEGELVGDIDLEARVAIGPSGKVTGSIRARSIRIAGRVEGNVACLEKVEILEKGTLEGDVISPRMVIAEGAFFKGKVEMNEPRRAGQKAGGSGKAKTENGAHAGG